MGQRQLHLLASHMRLRPGATADQVRTFPHVQPRPSPLRFHRYQVLHVSVCLPAHPPRAWHPLCTPPLALSLCTALCTHHLSSFVSFPDRSECELYNEVRYSVWHAGFPIENDSKRYENSFFFRCAGQNDACSKVNFAAVQRTPSRGFSLNTFLAHSTQGDTEYTAHEAQKTTMRQKSII